jgi:purine-nucleoside/S-methyl-5'-thioadenosine phosphorylase / adenosine deaminase
MSAANFIPPEWNAPRGVHSLMTTRIGGVSVAPWDSLNLGVHVGDDPAAVLENRQKVRKEGALPSEPVWLEQVHGTSVVELDTASTPRIVSDADQLMQSPRPRADASFTRQHGVVCAIQVADCMPVLFAARDGSVVGAAHAGWRGLASGVLGATVSAMAVPPGEVVAWMGPTIGREHFEVGDDVVTAFRDTAEPGDRASTEAAFQRKSDGKWLCDLYALARIRLAALGIASIFGAGWCTYEDAQRFYSYRRDGQTGRMAALIWLA